MTHHDTPMTLPEPTVAPITPVAVHVRVDPLSVTTQGLLSLMLALRLESSWRCRGLVLLLLLLLLQWLLLANKLGLHHYFCDNDHESCS